LAHVSMAVSAQPGLLETVHMRDGACDADCD
jgi:hypothetical protein